LESYDYDTVRLASFLNNEGNTVIARSIDNEWKRRVEKADRRRGINENRISPDAIEKENVWRQYGTTVLGLLITPSFYFAFQLGDGDILIIDESNAKYAVRPEKILGTETFSLSQKESWRKAVTNIGQFPGDTSRFTFMLSTDGFSNSYPDDTSFLKTSSDYYAAINEHGADAVMSNLRSWLNETSVEGSGDDITVLFAYYGESDNIFKNRDVVTE
jgi:serine/threonine protein phosphatase PrpC